MRDRGKFFQGRTFGLKLLDTVGRKCSKGRGVAGVLHELQFPHHRLGFLVLQMQGVEVKVDEKQADAPQGSKKESQNHDEAGMPPAQLQERPGTPGRALLVRAIYAGIIFGHHQQAGEQGKGGHQHQNHTQSKDDP